MLQLAIEAIDSGFSSAPREAARLLQIRLDMIEWRIGALSTLAAWDCRMALLRMVGRGGHATKATQDEYQDGAYDGKVEEYSRETG